MTHFKHLPHTRSTTGGRYGGGGRRRRLGRDGCPIGSIGSEAAEHIPRGACDRGLLLLRWQAAVRAALKAMHARGELEGAPEDLALTVSMQPASEISPGEPRVPAWSPRR